MRGYRDDEGFNWQFAVMWFVVFPLYIWGLVELGLWIWG